MSLKRRLAISNAAIVFIPIIITIAASFVYLFISSSLFNVSINFENIKKVSKINYELSKVEIPAFQDASDDMMKNSLLQYLASRLYDINAEIVVLKKRDIIFTTKEINKIELEKCLELENDKKLSNSVNINGNSYIIKVLPITFKDGQAGKTILLAPIGTEKSAAEGFLLFILVVYIISYLIVNAVLSSVVSKSVLKPIERLHSAAAGISCGNLEHEVIEEGDGEIQELCRAFEVMRLKLKESVYTQIKYDENRKMLISSISHDLKTPITSIKGYVEGILDGVADTPEKVDKYLKTVYSKAIHVDAMIDDLLLYSKLDLNQIPFNFEKTNIVKYFEDCIIENGPELENENINLRLQNEIKEHINVMIDRERLRRVINNVMHNAKKYMDKPHGEILVILRKTRTSIIIEIKDNGPGIPKEDLPYIFEKFYRSDVMLNRKDGSGLGLAIAKQIVEGHNGRIWAKSHGNEGTSIIISLKCEL